MFKFFGQLPIYGYESGCKYRNAVGNSQFPRYSALIQGEITGCREFLVPNTNIAMADGSQSPPGKFSTTYVTSVRKANENLEGGFSLHFKGKNLSALSKRPASILRHTTLPSSDVYGVCFVVGPIRKEFHAA